MIKYALTALQKKKGDMAGRGEELSKECGELTTEAFHAALRIGDVVEFGLAVLAL